MILDTLSISSVSNGEDTKSICSDNTSINSEYTNGDNNSISNDNRQSKKKKRSNLTAQTINYHGINIYQAAQKGNLPICVLLWGMGSSKRVNLMIPDIEGNNPMHYAALADNTEVISFFLQQTNGYLIKNELKLVDSRNHIGETPLLRAMTTGIPTVIKTLVDESSDPLVIDQRGNSIFTVLAKHGHFWCMNYVYHLVHKKYGTHVALELMSALDNDVHCSLDWAADTGDINTLEFLIRKGLTPLRVDNLNRSPLYWAVKRNRLKATKYLVKCGCDPECKDITGMSPLAIAQQMDNNALLLEALQVSKRTKESYNHWKSYVETDLAWTSINNPQYGVIEEAPPLFHMNNNTDKKESFAIDRDYQASKPMNALIYGLIVMVLGFTPLFVPFYIYTIMLGMMGYVVIIKFGQPRVVNEEGGNINLQLPQQLQLSEIVGEVGSYSNNNSNIVNSYSPILKDILYAREKGLGLWIGGMTVYFIYLLCAFLNYYVGISNTSNYSTDRKSGFYLYSPTALGGFTMVSEYTSFYWIVVCMYVLSVYFWVRLVWVDVDPGIVDTRDEDFEEVTIQSLSSSLGFGQPPPMHVYCPTTLVRKPLRSKYCTSKGCVIARMDHYCIWLNTTIGFGNHRLFMLFLISHFLLVLLSFVLFVLALHNEIPLSNNTTVCEVLSILLNGRYFFVVVLVMFFVIASIALGLLAIEQFVNMAKNITTNERINLVRYSSYLIPDPCDGSLDNKFDRGIITNILEFLQVPGYKVDYMTVFDIPTTSTDAILHSLSLTQENVQLLILSKNTHSSNTVPLLHHKNKNNLDLTKTTITTTSSSKTSILQDTNNNNDDSTYIVHNTKKELLGIGTISSSYPSPINNNSNITNNRSSCNNNNNKNSNSQKTAQQLIIKKLIDDMNIIKNNNISNNINTNINNTTNHSYNNIKNNNNNNNSNPSYNNINNSSNKIPNYNLLKDIEDIEMNLVREQSMESTDSFT